jgi:hypothetical protein
MKGWETASGAELACLCAHIIGVNGAAFIADGLHVLTALRDETARAWDVSRTAWLTGERGDVLAAGLAFGVGIRSATEARDDPSTRRRRRRQPFA